MPVASIIQSPLDTDYYKLTMGQMVWRHYRGVAVTYDTINRTTSVPLARFIREEDLRRELDHVRTLSFRQEELAYLRGLKIFGDDYLSFLAGMRLPPYELQWGSEMFSLRFRGPWENAIFWEIPALAIIMELYSRALLMDCDRIERQMIYERGMARLERKMELLGANPDVFFSDFATRRRFSRENQEKAVTTIARALPCQFTGTSNVDLARRHGFKPVGTCAHETFMVVAGLRQGTAGYCAVAQNEVLSRWWNLYGRDLSIALNDTLSSDFFFRTAPHEIARDWKGIRIDSGDPIGEGEKCLRWYAAHGIDPHKKILVFSDGLNPDAMIRIADNFRKRIGVAFGWGTNLSNDFGFPSVSLVIKAVAANGVGLVKLSNNIAKAIGSPADIERVIREIGYATKYNKECVY